MSIFIIVMIWVLMFTSASSYRKAEVIVVLGILVFAVWLLILILRSVYGLH